MCDDHCETVDDDSSSWGLTRRGLLTGTAALAGGLLASGRGSLLHPSSAAAVSTVAASSPTNGQGLLAYRHAMHVHTSYSEGGGSVEAQIAEASANGFDTLWTTDHDWRMSAYEAPDVFHFPALTERVQGSPYTWKPDALGALKARSGSISADGSPGDTAPGSGALVVKATSSGRDEATYRYVLDGGKANLRHRASLTGVTLLLDVLPQLGSGDAWGTVEIQMSYRPPIGGRHGGRYRLLYELGTAPVSHSAAGLVGRVRKQVTEGQWNSLRLDPLADVALLWPDLVAADSNLGQLFLGVTSRKRAAGTVSYSWLRFERATSHGDEPLRTQRELIAAYAERYPLLTVRQGIEVSGTHEHSNWFGGEPSLIDYRQGTPTLAAATALGHSYGCLVSLNHPLGSHGAGLTPAEQAVKRRKVAEELLASNVHGMDVVEAGYRLRGGGTLEAHLDLVDTLWRAGHWVTATGVNDNHGGTHGSWAHEANRFYTSLWQSTADAGDSLAALRRGSAFVGELGGFSGYLDLSVDGTPMGSASVDPLRDAADLVVHAWDLPTDAVVQVMRGPVDYTNALDPGTTLLSELSATELASGSATVSVPTTTSCFVRVQVRTADGRRVAFTNPVFLLREEPPEGRALPEDRRALVELPI